MSEWTSITEDIVRTIHASCERNRMRHLKEANASKYYHNVLTITGMTLGPMAGMLAGNTQISCGDNYVAKTTVVTLSVLSGIVVSIIKFGKFDEMHHLNKQASSSYHVLANNAQLELTKDRSTREPASEYISWLQLKYEEIFNQSPLIEVGDDTTSKPKQSTSRTGKVASEESSSNFVDIELGSNNAMTYEMKRMMNR
jgi:hypothetical protein